MKQLKVWNMVYNRNGYGMHDRLIMQMTKHEGVTEELSDAITFACTIDGMPVFISGNVDREEVFSIAKGIRKK
ncbi:MAG: hypothetical protein IJP92_10395 [Lachnospiraceae bacterium]|nr:hypothetical protein [Lachnospiraceae bacterium]